jgi:hypothetical protein
LILTKGEDLKPHKVLKKDPEWMQRPQSEPIMDVDLKRNPDLLQDIEHALGYLRTQELYPSMYLIVLSSFNLGERREE